MKYNKQLALGLLFLCIMAVSACTSSSALTGNSSWPGITADGDTVYAANGSFIEAVQNGTKLWSYPESANNRLAFFAAPAVDGDYVYAGTYTNQLHILNKADGTLVVSAEIGNNKNKVIAAPLVADGKVFVLSSGGMVSAYPAEVSGDSISPLWQTTLTGEVWVKPVYENGILYVASMDKKMNLLDGESGTVKDSLTISGAVMNDPVSSDGKLYFSTLAKEVVEMDLENGSLRTLLTTDGEIWASPLIMGDRLIAADMDGAVYCISVKDGTSFWKTDRLTAEKVGFIASPASLGEDTFVLVDESGETMVYTLEGKSVNQRSLSQSVYTTPAVLEDGSFTLVPVTTDGTIKAYFPDMAEKWSYNRSDNSAKAESTAASEEGK